LFSAIQADQFSRLSGLNDSGPASHDGKACFFSNAGLKQLILHPYKMKSSQLQPDIGQFFWHYADPKF